MMDNFRPAEEGELAAVYALRGRAFAGTGGDPTGDRAAWFARHDRDDPWRVAGANYLATRDGRMVATVRVFARRIQLGAGDVAVACLGDVATDLPYQGRGYMRRLLAFVNEQNVARGFALGLLATGSPGAYAGAGFRTIRVPWYALDLPLPDDVRTHAAAMVRAAAGAARWAVVPLVAARPGACVPSTRRSAAGGPATPCATTPSGRTDRAWCGAARRHAAPRRRRRWRRGRLSARDLARPQPPRLDRLGVPLHARCRGRCPPAHGGAGHGPGDLRHELVVDCRRPAGRPRPLRGRRAPPRSARHGQLPDAPLLLSAGRAEEVLRQEAECSFVYWLGDNV